MTFKEQYLTGLCTLDHIESCVEQWHTLPEDGTSLRDYLGLTEQEMNVYLQVDLTTTFQHLLDSQRRCQHYRIYQLDLRGGKTVPFALAGIKKMREKGYEQPPAALYRLVYDGAIFCPNERSERDVLEQIFTRYCDTLPGDFPGRNVAVSDVIELYEDNDRTYFYCDVDGFPGVKFSPMLSKRLNADT